jgi:hypothetical protein
MIQTTKTHRTSRTSFVPTTQKWAVLSLHGYRQIQESLLWHLHHNKAASTGNMGILTAATEGISTVPLNNLGTVAQVDEGQA